jgi:bifunctional non-homologous end joining protein LigD
MRQPELLGSSLIKCALDQGKRFFEVFDNLSALLCRIYHNSNPSLPYAREAPRLHYERRPPHPLLRYPENVPNRLQRCACLPRLRNRAIAIHPASNLLLHFGDDRALDALPLLFACQGPRMRLLLLAYDLTHRFPLIVEALARLRSRSCIIDGEAVACGDDGIASFDRIRYRRHDADVFMWAFDLIELNGDDVRRDPLAVRKATLERILARAAYGIRFNEHLDHEDGPLVFHHACKLGLEGIVSKRCDSPNSSGRSPHWIKSKNPNAPAVRREADEDWSGRNPERKRLLVWERG